MALRSLSCVGYLKTLMEKTQLAHSTAEMRALTKAEVQGQRYCLIFSRAPGGGDGFGCRWRPRCGPPTHLNRQLLLSERRWWLLKIVRSSAVAQDSLDKAWDHRGKDLLLELGTDEYNKGV